MSSSDAKSRFAGAVARAKASRKATDPTPEETARLLKKRTLILGEEDESDSEPEIVAVTTTQVSKATEILLRKIEAINPYYGNGEDQHLAECRCECCKLMYPSDNEHSDSQNIDSFLETSRPLQLQAAPPSPDAA